MEGALDRLRRQIQKNDTCSGLHVNGTVDKDGVQGLVVHLPVYVDDVYMLVCVLHDYNCHIELEKNKLILYPEDDTDPEPVPPRTEMTFFNMVLMVLLGVLASMLVGPYIQRFNFEDVRALINAGLAAFRNATQ